MLAGRHPFGFRLDPPPGPYAKNDPLSQLMRLQINTFAFLKGSTTGAGNTHKLIYEASPIVTQNIRVGRFTGQGTTIRCTKNVTIRGTGQMTFPVESVVTEYAPKGLRLAQNVARWGIVKSQILGSEI